MSGTKCIRPNNKKVYFRFLYRFYFLCENIMSVHLKKNPFCRGYPSYYIGHLLTTFNIVTLENILSLYSFEHFLIGFYLLISTTQKCLHFSKSILFYFPSFAICHSQFEFCKYSFTFTIYNAT